MLLYMAFMAVITDGCSVVHGFNEKNSAKSIIAFVRLSDLFREYQFKLPAGHADSCIHDAKSNAHKP